MRDRLRKVLTELMLLPGLSGHEDRVRRAIARRMAGAGIEDADRPTGQPGRNAGG